MRLSRGLDALNYACYQDARFMVVGTPSGVSLSGEGGAHQSIASPLIGMSQDGLASFGPAFADELAIIMAWAFDYMQRDGQGDPNERTWLRDETGGSVYLRLSTRQIEQPSRKSNPNFAQEVIDGATWLKEPGSNAGWQAAQRARAQGNHGATSHAERLLDSLPPHCKIITVIDGHPATLS